MQAIADIHASWLDSGEPIVYYERLVEDDFGTLKEAFIDRMQLPISEESLRTAVETCRFEQLSGGRSKGTEDQESHYRKGVAGDWRNYFTPKVTDAFKKRFGDILIAAGYENDQNW
jgi:lipopolysaccharide transport system ATP-binding protein